MPEKLGSEELKNFKELQEATHYRLCESIHKLTEQVNQRLESIERKLESIIQDRDGEPN